VVAADEADAQHDLCHGHTLDVCPLSALTLPAGSPPC
jgi:hypothetical protein